MAMLESRPAGSQFMLDPGQPFVYTSSEGGTPRFVLVPRGSKWLLYDVAGTTRVSGKRIPGAATLRGNELITTGSVRFLFIRGGDAAFPVTIAQPTVCSFCRSELTAGAAALECPECRRAHHSDCLELSGRCGRCGTSLPGNTDE